MKPAHDHQAELVWLDPATLAEHPRNVRTELGDLTGLTASIAAQGVIEPLTVVPLPDGGHLTIAGHRRTAAAIAAGVSPVPCVVRTDLSADVADDAGQVEHLGAMLAENIHRQSLTAVEEARGVQTMLDLGATVATVAARTGLDRKRVALAAGVARLDAGTAHAVSASGLTLDQAAAVALYADDPDTSARLVAAAEHGEGNFAHAVTRARQDRTAREAYLKRKGELKAAGRTLVDSAEHSGGQNRSVLGLEHDGQPITPEGHASCPGSAVHLSAAWDGFHEQEVCTDFRVNGHTDRWSTAKTKPETPAEKESARAERRTVIENNKAMAAANETRRAWVKELLARRSVGKDVLRFAVETLAAAPSAVGQWLGHSYDGNGSNDAQVALGISAPRQWGSEKTVSLTSGEQVPDARLPVQLLAHVAGALESSITRETWRSAGVTTGASEVARWLLFLVDQGYTLAPIEQTIVKAATPRRKRGAAA